MESRGDLLGELLAQLNAPLIVRIDSPDRTLDKGDVLVQGDKGTQCVRGKVDAKDGGSGTVALEAAGGNHPLGGTLGANLVSGLAKSEGLCLGKEVAQEQLVDVLAVVLNCVGSIHKRDEVSKELTPLK